jgi:hypothetical protein
MTQSSSLKYYGNGMALVCCVGFTLSLNHSHLMVTHAEAKGPGVEKSAVPVSSNCETTGGELDIIVDIYQM